MMLLRISFACQPTSSSEAARGPDHTPHTVYSLTKRVSPEMLQTFDATEDIGYCDYLGTIHKV